MPKNVKTCPSSEITKVVEESIVHVCSVTWAKTAPGITGCAGPQLP